MQPDSSDVVFIGRTPEFYAAVVNGALAMLFPVAFGAYLDYTSMVVRPWTPTVFSSVVSALPALIVSVPVAIGIAFRTFVHARSYRRNRFTVWHGPVESAAIGAGIALTIMVPATVVAWTTRPALQVLAYILFYVGATALVGLVVGLLLASIALAVVRLAHLRLPGAARL